MRKSILLKAAIVGAVAAMSFGANAAGKCSLATLKGYYVFNSSGSVNGIAYSDSGNEYYDGKGNITGRVVDNKGNANILKGTYTIDASLCTGVINYTLPEPEIEQIYLGPKGDVFTYIETGEGTSVSGTGTRQGK